MAECEILALNGEMGGGILANSLASEGPIGGLFWTGEIPKHYPPLAVEGLLIVGDHTQQGPPQARLELLGPT